MGGTQEDEQLQRTRHGSNGGTLRTTATRDEEDAAVTPREFLSSKDATGREARMAKGAWWPERDGEG
ncbi:hypothetical protein SESBI_11187 [Sesbania bispinosa]|nr:hypothetical protein SESBI_11187 [Sesbania bispinosa]